MVIFDQLACPVCGKTIPWRRLRNLPSWRYWVYTIQADGGPFRYLDKLDPLALAERSPSTFQDIAGLLFDIVASLYFRGLRNEVKLMLWDRGLRIEEVNPAGP